MPNGKKVPIKNIDQADVEYLISILAEELSKASSTFYDEDLYPNGVDEESYDSLIRLLKLAAENHPDPETIDWQSMNMEVEK